MERRPVRPGSEEYLDSEKYQLRPRDFEGAIARGESIAPLLAHLNTIRREHPALQWLRNITFHDVDNDGILVFSKVTGEDRLIVACSTDPHHMREGWLHLDMAALGLPDDAGFQVHDLLSGARYDWGQHNFVRLDPGAEGVPAHILHVTT
jgi:starch synthase (maltosyl-transferring)